MLNNFGAGGSNAAVLVSEHISSTEAKDQILSSATTTVCGFSAKSERAIIRLRDTLAEYLKKAQEGHSSPSFYDVCATLTSRRQIYEYRIAVTARSLEDLTTKLHNVVPYKLSSSPCPNPRAVFVFSGQGSQVS
jgi:acyl transferase domain-containing protein